MRILISGGAGFIGSHLAESFLKDGHSVIALDDLSTGSIQNVEKWKAEPRFEYVIDSVMNRPVVAELVDRCDIVYHLAAAVGVRLIIESPVHTIETNVHGTEVILEMANKKKKKVLVASTSEVYGKSNKMPFTEDHDMVLGPSYKGRWSYACGKALDEFLTLAYWKERKLPVIVVRLFNVVGPRQTGRYGMVVPNFVQQALAGRPITVFGDGTQTRTFLHVADAVKALRGLMECPAATGEVVNVGHEKEISILDLAKRVKVLTQSQSEIRFVPYEEAYEEGFEDMPRRVPSTAKARRLINFSPVMDMDGILRDVIAYFQGRNGDS
jgi:UDP-glucose 4-epimerase